MSAVLDPHGHAHDHDDHHHTPTGLMRWITTTNHKDIGSMYLWFSFVMFMVGGAMAMVIRAELFQPGLQLVNPDFFNSMTTMHGLIMVFGAIMPAFVGFANWLIPIQIGAADMAFARMNNWSFWILPFAGSLLIMSFFMPGGAPGVGWTMYAPLTSQMGIGMDLTIFAVHLLGMSSIMGSINIVTTILNMRAPGMTLMKMPLFCWTWLITGYLLIASMPVLAGAVTMTLTDRHFGTSFFNAAGGGDPVLYQHIFWFFGHPEVYILALPFFGIATEILPVFSRKPIFGYKGLIAATIAIAALSVAVWAHHMYATGQVSLPFFSFMTFLIAVPTGVKFFNWIGTMWRGSVSFETPMLWVMGFLITFLMGGLTGIILASPPLDFAVSASYFVVAHFHYVLFGTVVFAMFAGFYFWWPKMTGHMLNETLGKIHFWTLFFGFHLTFLIQHWLGIKGMPRRYADYLASDGFTNLNTISTIGSGLLALSMIPFFINIWISRKGPKVEVDDPWGYGASLEWATSCPPPRHNFLSIPRIRSERPAFDLKFPDVKTEKLH